MPRAFEDLGLLLLKCTTVEGRCEHKYFWPFVQQQLCLVKIQCGGTTVDFVEEQPEFIKCSFTAEFHFAGDILVGTRNVDANWWEGRCGHQMGIFPVTHVTPLDLDTSSTSSANQNTGASPVHRPPSAVQPGPAQPNPTPPGDPVAMVRANMDLTAQLDEELSFRCGDIISVLEIVDSDFCVGECNGRKGQFPVWCVDVLEGNLNLPPKQEKRVSKFGKKWWEEDSGENAHTNSSHNALGITQNSSAINSQVAMETQPSISHSASLSPDSSQSQSQTVKNHIENIKNEYNSQQTENNNTKTFQKTHKRNKSYTMENISSYDTTVTPYGKTLFPFIAENPNELTFFDNEIVVLIRYVDEQWMEGEINGQRGIFPISYVDIIVDCARNEPGLVQNGAQPVAMDTSQDGGVQEFGDDVYGRVLYDFTAESERDLDMVEGDTVTVLRRLNEHWFEAKHDNGRVGLCPVSFVELITNVPSPVTESPGKPSTPSSLSSQKPEVGSVTPSGASPATISRSEGVSPSSQLADAVPSPPCDNRQLPTDIGTPAVAENKTTTALKTTARPKPGLKPKPMLKPKPPLHKATSVGTSDSSANQKSQMGRKSYSIDSDGGSTSPRDQASTSAANKRLSMPAFSQSQQVTIATVFGRALYVGPLGGGGEHNESRIGESSSSPYSEKAGQNVPRPRPLFGFSRPQSEWSTETQFLFHCGFCVYFRFGHRHQY